MIKHLEIKGFKSIKEAQIELKPINILIGGNGSGKSNFISFFKLLEAVVNKELQDFLKKEDVDKLLYFGRKTTEKLFGEIIYSDENYNNSYHFSLTQTDSGGLFIEKEELENNVGWHFSSEHTEESNFTKELGLVKGLKDMFSVKSLFSFRIFHFHDTSNTSVLRKECDVSDNLYLRPDGRNLPAMLYLLKEKHPIIYARIEKTIQSVAPYISKFIVEPSRLKEDKIELRWVDKGDSESNFSVYQLSDGTLRFIALAVLLMQPNPPAVIIIDEPELGLHPFAIAKLAGMMQSASSKAQIIAATQSPGLISNFAPEDVIVIDKSETENQTIFNRLDSESLTNWLENYTLGDLWERNIINAAQPFEK
jgi:predicted ATPase